MAAMKDIVAGQMVSAVTKPNVQPGPAIGRHQDGNARVLPADRYVKAENTGTNSVSGQSGGLEQSNCRCGNCPACAAQAYSSQATGSSSGQLATEQSSPSPTPDESAKQNLSPDSSVGQKGADGEPLNREELAVLSELKKTDRVVRAHEQAHMAAASGIVTKGMSFSYQQGPDGKRYAVGGEVQIDTGKENTPAATIAKMQKVRAAALAPASPSSQDRKVAASAMTEMSQARVELRVEQAEEAEMQRQEIVGERAEGNNDSSDEGYAVNPEPAESEKAIAEPLIAVIPAQSSYSAAENGFNVASSRPSLIDISV